MSRPLPDHNCAGAQAEEASRRGADQHGVRVYWARQILYQIRLQQN